MLGRLRLGEYTFMKCVHGSLRPVDLLKRVAADICEQNTMSNKGSEEYAHDAHPKKPRSGFP